MSTTTANASSSRITSATPVKAITSKIAGRSTPSIPPASQSYEPLVKTLFRYRLNFVLLLSALAASCVVNLWALWQAGGTKQIGFWGTLSLPFSPWILFMSFLTWTTVALPIIVLRKVFLTSRRSAAASPLGMVKVALAQNSTRIASVTYVLSSICALVVHIMLAYMYEGTHADPKLTLFVKSKKHPHYLNGRLVFLIITQLVTAFAFALRGAMLDRFVYRWALATNPKHNSTTLMIVIGFAVSAVFTTLAIAVASLFFAVARLFLPVLYKIPLLSILLRPFTAHFLKGSWTLSLPLFHITLFFRAWFLAFSTFVTWETADCLFENIVTETTPLSTIAADPNTTLVSGITSTDRVFSFFAYSELRELAMDETASASARRTALFGDQKNVPNLWSYVARESLLLLGNDYQLFLRRGQPPPPPIAPTPVKPTVIPGPQIVATPLLRQKVFKTMVESPGQAALDALASDGPISKVVEIGADATHVPELFRSVETKVMSSPIAEEAKKNVKTAKGLGDRLKDETISLTTSYAIKHFPEAVKDTSGKFLRWLKKDRLSKVVESSLPYRELDVVVIDVLSYLTCHSLTEDRYGVVQRDIPRILEAMISYLSAIEEHQIQIRTQYPPSTSTTLSTKEREEQETIAGEVQMAQDTLSYLADGFKEGIGRIVRTFGDKLLAFKFPPRIAHKLQAFLDYS